jgi:hypothetical protein
VTPFDPHALLVMLLTFYPIVSVAALQRARAERPEYFAAGTLFGSKGEKLLLPDGRAFDLIFAAGGLPGQQRWQVIEAGPGGDGDGFGLEAGPLAPVDEPTAVPPLSDPTFVPLVSGAIGELHVLEQRIGDSGTTIASNVADGDVAPVLDVELGEAFYQHEQTTRALEGESIAELMDHTDGLEHLTDGYEANVPDQPPGTEPEPPAYDPGNPPPEEPPIDNPPPPEA